MKEARQGKVPYDYFLTLFVISVSYMMLATYPIDYCNIYGAGQNEFVSTSTMTWKVLPLIVHHSQRSIPVKYLVHD